jgi:hypothetical protein
VAYDLTISQDEIDAFADRYSESELVTIRNAAMDAITEDKNEVVITSLGMDNGNGSGQLTGKPRYLLALCQRAIAAKRSGNLGGLVNRVNFATRRLET